MLTRSIYVRKLQPVNLEEFQANPAGYSGEWQDNPESEIGEIVSEHLIPEPDATNPGMVLMKTVVGVVWSVTKIPAISYENVSLLKCVDDDVLEDDGEEEYDDEE